MARRRTPSRSGLPLLRGKLLWVAIAVFAVGWLAVQAHEAGWVNLGGLYTVLTGNEAPPPADDVQVAGSFEGDALRLVSWNIANLGGSKDEVEIGVMADVLAPAADVVAVQEVITSPAGEEAVRRLGAALRRRSGSWEWTLSPPTTGRGSERYAFFWRTDRVRLDGSCFFDDALVGPVDREPFLCPFSNGRQSVLVASFHAVPTSKDPETENRLLDGLDQRYEQADLVVVGDFNQPARHSAFDGLRARGFADAVGDERTTLKAVRSPSGETRANPYDHIFYETDEIRVARAGVLDFTDRFGTLRDARAVSDHLPVFADLMP